MSRSNRKAVYKETGALKEVHSRRVRRIQNGFLRAHQLDIADDDFDTPMPIQKEIVDSYEICDYSLNYEDDKSTYMSSNDEAELIRLRLSKK